MNTYLDNEQVRGLDLAPAATVRDLIATLQRELNGSGRMLVGIRADGQDVPDAEIDRVLRARLADFDRLDLTSIDTRAAVLETLRTALGLCQDSEQSRHQIADAFNQGRTAQALEALGDCLTVWSSAADSVVKSAALLRIDLTALQTVDGPVQAWLESLAAQLRQLRDALNVSDFVLTADILRYEMESSMRGWELVLAAMIDAIEGAAVDAPCR